jgi:hypothetical protein
VRLFDVDRRYGQQIETAILTALVYTLALLQFVCVRRVSAQSRADTHAKVELGLDESSESAKTMWVGVVFHLEPGWHIYWQNPGDSGEPPKIQWELPAGFRAGAVRWPQPIRLGSGSVVDYGYELEVLLAAPIERPAVLQPGLTAEIAAAVNYLVCRDAYPGRLILLCRCRPSDRRRLSTAVARPFSTSEGTTSKENPCRLESVRRVGQRSLHLIGPDRSGCARGDFLPTATWPD